ncbi:hypothetical protein ELI_13590 [Erythrobacter litoralis HTCC2594]|uniref:Uncharacterized protein n=2 Tax=Erythrobacter litoralis TaxID=39960 RepID=Q2N681_ERYLH|nr:hypothetical protein ELI_13590 [Erythrobacter litoralis HTCC2594]
MRACNVKQRLSIRSIIAKGFRMGEDRSKDMSREERLAAKLRENLRKRKAQAKELNANSSESDESGLSKHKDAG